MASNDNDELMNAHEGLQNPGEYTLLEDGDYRYYHYNCDSTNDAGWGCGYRTTQTMCSQIRLHKLKLNRENNITSKVADVPTIRDIQKILAECGDKTEDFVGSKQWIGSFEACLVIDVLYDVTCKIIHCEPHQLGNYFNLLWSHFEMHGSIIMMGGDLDNESKGILGVSRSEEDKKYLLIADPHCRFNKQNKPSKLMLHSDKWISWESTSLFDNGSFYNFCLPQLKA